MKKTLRQLILNRQQKVKDNSLFLGTSLTEGELSTEVEIRFFQGRETDIFSDDYQEIESFCYWTEDYVYILRCIDGDDLYIVSVPKTPCAKDKVFNLAYH